MNRARRVVLAVVACVAAVYGIAAADLWLRARTAYQEGEKYLLWDQRPELKAAHLDKLLAEDSARLRQDFASGRLPRGMLEERLALARFGRDEAMKESAVKFAYVWFKTAAELFSPPENRWTRLARGRMPVARNLWKKELELQKIPYQDYMLE